LGASARLQRADRAFRSNLFYRTAVKKDFRCNPLRALTLKADSWYAAKTDRIISVRYGRGKPVVKQKQGGIHV
jgi:hypothetical protein